jgi:dipeptidyl aminopeptidase/acylaminoacyl peptidase
MDWRDRFRAGVVRAAARASRRPDRGVIVADHEGNDEAYAWDVETGALRKVSDSGTAVLEAAIRPDGASIVYHRDPTGSEFGHLHEAPFDGGASTDLTPDLPEYANYGLRVAGDVVVAGMAAGDDQSLLIVRPGSATVAPMPTVIMDLRLAPDGSTVAVAEAMDGLYGRTILRATEDASEVDRLDHSWPGGIHEGRVAVAVHRDGWLRPAIWTPGRGVDAIDVELPGDVRPESWSDDGNRILLSQWHRASGSLASYDVRSGVLSRLASPGGAPAEWLAPELHGDAATAVWSDAQHPWSVWAVDDTNARRLLTVSATSDFRGADWENVELASADGTPIQAWLLRPQGSGPWPTILHGHGGPTGAFAPWFSPSSQAWVDNGFAFLTVNYRGSTTFGDDYREALTRHIGEIDVADMMAGHAWLLASGVADPDRIIVNGYSYGGYLALQCPALHPGAFAAAIAGAPVADWLLSGEDQNAFLDAYDRALFGAEGAETDAMKRRASPRTYVERYAAPVLITTPSEDTRTPLRPIQAFVGDMRRAGKSVRLELLEGGHAGVGTDQEIAMMESWLEFAGDIVRGASGRIG